MAVYSLTFSLILALANGYPYNNFEYHKLWSAAPRYPGTCCQLEWIDIRPGDSLPSDYIHAGEFNHRSFAFTRSSKPLVAVKSDQRSEAAHWLGYEQFRTDYYPILSNPNNCSIGWYKKRFPKEEIPEVKEWFFPSIGFSRFGEFARYQNEPGWLDGWDNGDIAFPRMRKDSADWTRNPEDVELLYVDCYKSILAMSKSKLIDMSYDTSELESLKANPIDVVYRKDTLVNNSTLKSKSTIKFSVETVDESSLTLSKSHSNYFSTDEKTYNEWSVNAKVSTSWKILGLGGEMSIETGWRHSKERTTSSGNTAEKGEEVFKATSTRKVSEFSQEVELPPLSITTLTAFSRPLKGDIPFTAVYKLTPKGTSVTTVEILERTLKEYGLDRKMEKTAKGTLLVHFDGKMHVDIGHKIDVNIQSVSLPGHSYSRMLIDKTYHLNAV